MANTFKNYFLQSTSSAANVIVGPASTQTTVIGMSIANKTNGEILANVVIYSAGTGYSIIYKAAVPPGSTLVPIGGDQKLVVETDDYVQVDTTASADVVASVVEITS
jgi:hypothetical protein